MMGTEKCIIHLDRKAKVFTGHLHHPDFEEHVIAGWCEECDEHQFAPAWIRHEMEKKAGKNDNDDWIDEIMKTMGYPVSLKNPFKIRDKCEGCFGEWIEAYGLNAAYRQILKSVV